MHRPLLIRLARLTAILSLTAASQQLSASDILWSQYCQHQGKMKLLVYLDSDPTVAVEAASGAVELSIRESENESWERIGSEPIDRLTATALFEIEAWPRFTRKFYRVTCGDSVREGIFRAEPEKGSVLKLAGLSCHKDIGWPWKEAIDEVIAHDPDLVFFSGDQIYENDYNSPMFRADAGGGSAGHEELSGEIPQIRRGFWRTDARSSDDHDHRRPRRFCQRLVG